MTDGNDVDADAAEPAADAVEPTADDVAGTGGVDETDAGRPERAPDGYVRLRRALLGVGLLWLAAVAGVGALLATVYGTRTSSAYLAVAVAATTLSVGAGYASLRTFGYA